MLMKPEASEHSTIRKIDHPVFVLEPVGQQNGIGTVMLLPGRYIIGSSSECNVDLPIQGVEPLHCLIIAGSKRTVLKAWNPQTLLNGEPVREADLKSEDRLAIGPIEFLVREIEVEHLPDPASRTGQPDGPSAPTTGNKDNSVTHLSGSQRLSRAMSKALEAGGSRKPAETGSRTFRRDLLQGNRDQIVDDLDRVQQQLNRLEDREQELVSTQEEMISLEKQLQTRERELTRKAQELEKYQESFDRQEATRLSDLEEQNQDLQTQIKDLQNQNRSLQEQTANLNSRIAGLQVQENLLQENRQLVERREQELDQREEAFKQRDRDLAAIEEEWNSKNDALKAEFESQRQNFEGTGRREAQLAALEESLSKREEQLSELTAKAESEKITLKQEWESVRSREQELTEQNAQLERRKTELSTEEIRQENLRRQFDERLQQFEEERNRLHQERNRFEEERKQLEENRSSSADRQESFEDGRKQLDEERQALRNEIDAERNKLDGERKQLETREDELTEAISVFNSERDDFNTRKQQLESDRKTLDDDSIALKNEQETLEATRKDLSQSERELESERKNLADETEAFRKEQEEFAASRAEWEERQKSATETPVADDQTQPDSTLQHLLEMASGQNLQQSQEQSEESSTGEEPTATDDSALSSLLSEPISEIEPVGETQTPGPEPFSAQEQTGAETDTDNQLSKVDDEESMSVTKYMEDLLKRTRENRYASQQSAVAPQEFVIESGLQQEDPDNWILPQQSRTTESENNADLKEQPEPEEVLPPYDPDSPPDPLYPQDKTAARSDLSSLRTVANISARSAIARHSSKKIRESIFFKIFLAMVAAGITFELLHGKLINLQGEDLQTFVLAMAVISGITILELVRAALKTVVNDHRAHRQTKQIRRSQQNDREAVPGSSDSQATVENPNEGPTGIG